jgi:hypothetical protein
MNTSSFEVGNISRYALSCQSRLMT